MTRLEPLLEALVVVAALATIPIVVLQEQGIEHVFVSLADWAVWAVFFTELTVMAGLSGAPLAYARRQWLSVVVVVLSFPSFLPCSLSPAWPGSGAFFASSGCWQ